MDAIAAFNPLHRSTTEELLTRCITWETEAALSARMLSAARLMAAREAAALASAREQLHHAQVRWLGLAHRIHAAK
jgi:hypothetical protein